RPGGQRPLPARGERRARGARRPGGRSARGRGRVAAHGAAGRTARAMNRAGLARLFAPQSLALVGGAWADAVQAASRAVGFTGEVWRIHPERASGATQHYYRSVDELPGAPDATFIAAPNRDVPGIAAALARRGAGGFVCFAAGFSETA